MKQLLRLFLLFFIFPAFAVTSESYVDSAVNTLQNEIPAENAHTVLTNTGTAGKIGTKKIYDETQGFGTQTDALVTAETFNAAVQNAIDNEYVCIEWMGEHVPGNCLLWQLQNKTPQQTLPSAYTQLEYLESTGVQYINTGRKLYGTDTVEVKYSDFVKVNSDNMLFGHYSDNSFAYNLMFDNIYIYLHSRVGQQVEGISNTGVHTIRLGNNRFYFDNQLRVRFKDRSTDFQTNAPVTIFSAGSNYKSTAKVYYYMVTNYNNEIVQYLVPARRNSNGKLGMYDMITGTFFTNAGTGSFIAGPDVSSNLYLPNSGQ